MQRAIAVIGVLVFAMLALNGIYGVFGDTVRETGLQTQEQETFNVSTGALTSFQDPDRESAYYNDNITLEQNGTVYEPDGNYTWYTNGTLFVPTDTNLSDGNTTNITYQYGQPTQEQQVVRDVSLVPFQLGEGLGIAAGAILLLGAVGLLARQA